MKAMVLPKFGAPLELRDVPMPTIEPNDVLLRVRATGVGLRGNTRSQGPRSSAVWIR